MAELREPTGKKTRRRVYRLMPEASARELSPGPAVVGRAILPAAAFQAAFSGKARAYVLRKRRPEAGSSQGSLPPGQMHTLFCLPQTMRLRVLRAPPSAGIRPSVLIARDASGQRRVSRINLLSGLSLDVGFQEPHLLVDGA